MGNSAANTSYGINPTVNCKLIESEPGVQIFQNAEGEQFEKYIIPCQPSLEKTYEFRVNYQHPQLVDLLYAGQPKGFTCNSPPNIIVVTERIPYRLVHLPLQQPHNALAILHSSLIGFKDLFQKNQLFCIRDTMIGISAKNKVKVWLNPNFAVNTPEPLPHSFSVLEASQYEKQMVQNIFDLVNSKADNNSTWRQLIYARQKRNLHTFEEALTLLEDFSHAHRITISDEVRNPFNKNIHQKDDYNSEIDKLEELKNRGLVDGEEDRRHKIGYVGEDRRVGGNIHMLKQKIINAGSRQGRNMDGAQKDREVRQPFQQIERSMRGASQPGTSSYSHLPRPMLIEHSRPVQHSPATTATRVYSPGKPMAIKFRYQGRHANQSPQILKFQPPFQPQAPPPQRIAIEAPKQQETNLQSQFQHHQNQIAWSTSAPKQMQPSPGSNAEAPSIIKQQPQETNKDISIRRSNLPNQTDQTIIDVLGDMKQDDKNILDNFSSPKHERGEQSFERQRKISQKQEVDAKQQESIEKYQSSKKEHSGKELQYHSREEHREPQLVTSDKAEEVISPSFFPSVKHIQKQQKSESSPQSKPSEPPSPEKHNSSKYEINVNSPNLTKKQSSHKEIQLHQISAEAIENTHPLFHVRQSQSINDDIPVLTQAAINKLTEQFFPQAKKAMSIDQKARIPKPTTQSTLLQKRQLPSKMTTSQQIKKSSTSRAKKIDSLKTPKDKISQTVPSPRTAKINSLLDSKGKGPKISYKDMRKLLLQTMDDC